MTRRLKKHQLRGSLGEEPLEVLWAVFFGVTTATLTGTAMRTSEAASSSEQKRFNSRITEQSMLGLAWWGFNIDDPHEREEGIEMSNETLPSAEFEFLGNSDAPSSLPEHLNIEVASYWSIITSSGHDLTWLKTLLASKTGYSNLCQVVTMAVPSNLSKRSTYKATLHVNSGYRVRVRHPGSVEVIPLIRFGNDYTPVQSRDLRKECLLELRLMRFRLWSSVSIVYDRWYGRTSNNAHTN